MILQGAGRFFVASGTRRIRGDVSCLVAIKPHSAMRNL
jgi:hypothetical protein